MFTKEEATKERVEAMLDALEREKEGYEFRIRSNDSRERLSKDDLKARVKGVDAEISRCKGLLNVKPPTARELAAQVPDFSDEKLADLLATDERKEVKKAVEAEQARRAAAAEGDGA